MRVLPYDEIMDALRRKRRKLDVTQRELANRVGISKSMLSQMEHGKKDAKYATVHDVWQQLQIMEQEQGETAEELMNAPVNWVRPDDSALDVRSLMHEHDFSQVPVAEDGEMVGSITERDMMDVGDAETPVKEFMGEPFETVSKTTGRNAVRELLKDDNDALIVTEGKKYLGIITKADLI